MRIKGLTYKNENKDEISIWVVAHIDHDKAIFKIDDISIKGYKKRKEVFIARTMTDDWEYRKIDYDQRGEYLHKKFIEYATDEQMKAAIFNAWESIMPKWELAF